MWECVREKELNRLFDRKKQRRREKKKTRTTDDGVDKRNAEAIRLEWITTCAKYQQHQARPDVEAVQPMHETLILSSYSTQRETRSC